MKKLFSFKLILISLFFLLSSNLVLAADKPSPLVMLDSTSQQMLSALKKEKASMAKDPRVVYRIVDDILLPHLDVKILSRSVVGRDAWLKAPVAQQNQFSKQFTLLLIRTYASALSSYTDQRIEFKPLRDDYRTLDRVQVDSTIVQEDGPPIPVSYRLIWQGTEWKVYDFSVDGVSMIESFRAQFANDLSQGGLVNLINKLEQHNDTTA